MSQFSPGAKLEEISIPFEKPLVPATLIRRYKRFLADVTLADGSLATVHCPNSGSMLTSIQEGAPVFLSPAANPNRKTAYTWEMIRLQAGWVGVNTALPNALTALAAGKRALAIFKDVRSVQREVKIGPHTRIDLVAQTGSGPMYVEVKNVTLVRDGEARFPDSVTTRGAKHLSELAEYVRGGGAAAMVYVVQRPDGLDFGPARDIDPEYARLYDEARRAGVLITAVEARVSPEEVRLVREMPLAL